jgi:hypothetical protein
MDGNAGWNCDRWSKPLSLNEQDAGCPTQLFIPALVPGELLDVDEENETIKYRLANGEIWTDGGVSD